MSGNRPVNPIGTLVGTPVDTSGASWFGGLWYQQLLPASWRNVPFVMSTAPTKAGRRVVVHDYPDRDTVWAEDLGRLPRRFALTGYLAGDDVYVQKAAMIAACETAGPGVLVHPTLGAMQCVLIDFTTTDRADRGRYVEVEFEFVQYAVSVFPVSGADTGANIESAADGVNTAAAADQETVLETVPATPEVSVDFVGDYSTLAVDAVNDPARSLTAVNGLSDLNGRYATGSMTTPQPAGTTVDDALATSVASRQDVLDAADGLVNAAQAV